MKKNFTYLLSLVLLVQIFQSCMTYREGEIYYSDGHTSKAKIGFPIEAGADRLKVKSSERDAIKTEDVAYLKIPLNKGKDIFILKSGYLTQIRKDGDMDKSREKSWFLVDFATKKLMVCASGASFFVDEVRGVPKMVVSYYAGGGGYMLAKPDDNIVVNLRTGLFGPSLKKNIKYAEDYLFPDCPDFYKKLDYESLREARSKYVHEIAKAYKEYAQN